MPQFFAKVDKGIFLIFGDEARHISCSYRIKIGEKVFVFNENGKRYEGIVEKIKNYEVSGKIIKEITNPKKKIYIHLYQALIKKQKFETILRFSTELGVDEITPIITKRTIYKSLNLQRCNKILFEATKQCLRSSPPKLNPLKKFNEVIGVPSNDSKLLAYEGEEKNSLINSLKGKNFKIFIGPEGGFAPEEVELAKEYEFSIFSLGPNILRAETAAICVISTISQYFL